MSRTNCRQCVTRTSPPSSATPMAALRNLAISLHRLAGATNIAKALRHHNRNALRPLQLLEII
jgi:hypothetical protein